MMTIIPPLLFFAQLSGKKLIAIAICIIVGVFFGAQGLIWFSYYGYILEKVRYSESSNKRFSGYMHS